MSRRVLAALLVIVISTAVGFGAAPASARTHPSGCGGAVKRVSGATKGAPVLFVHGFAGAPSDFRRRLDDDRPSMLRAIRDIDGVVAYAFDYSDRSLHWVTDPAIGPALGRAIVCIAQRQDAPVTIVAHSMGGLATREAQGGLVDGVPVVDAIARVITIGTPFAGAQLLGIATGTAGDVLSSIIRTALRACDADISGRPDRTFCGLLGVTETEAVQAMIPGSAALAALPPWPDGLPIQPSAAEIEIGIDGPFGFSEQFAIGDFAVSLDSATADASPGVHRFVAECQASLFDIIDAIDDSACSHANELANRRIVRHVRTLVERGVRKAS